MHFAIFDIETRIDKALLKAIYYPDEPMSEDEAYRKARQQTLEEQQGRSDFLPLSFHVPISIAVGSVNEQRILTSVEILGEENSSEEGIVRAFWQRLEHFKGTLVSFNGRSFDLPVLELQALKYGCQAPAYFNERYGHRYRYSEEKHYDLIEFLINFGTSRLRGGFNLVTRLIGFPGKTVIDGSKIQELWESGKLDEIHTYCKHDVIQTYFLFLRIELIRGRITPEQYHEILERSAPYLEMLNKET